ncbi:hypothetical protein KMZ32_14855 [Phycicoccus sp. MAQZ13P-2]|uniref:hypothetical protein n=1 Tax=Phycicoccus mangrovi TaxID=2840470 RepID=UPI001C008B5A|nr:hypothetical protein [Phycicoccus mangrovi]MBT9255641.1 hypothetical protein [Phycicoccus mangrovi]MBT9275355.1 hypothetical protein [Phycicoccus mangrovi]
MSGPVGGVQVLQVPGTARRPRGLVPWVVGAFVGLPLAVWVALAVGVGLEAPLFFVLVLVQPLVLFGGPFRWAAVRRRRGLVRFVRTPGRLTFPATGVDRWCYLLMSLGLILLPFVAMWDLGRVGSESSGVVRAFLWAAPPLSASGLFWLRGWTPTSLARTPTGVVVHVNCTETTLRWDDLPPVDAVSAPRLDRTLRAAGTPFPGTLLRSDPDVVADLVELYRTHPELRSELVGGRVPERLRGGDLWLLDTAEV